MIVGAILLSAACHSLPVPDRPPAGTVSVEAVLTPPPWQRDGQMCVRVRNGTAGPLRYRRPGLRLDRHVRAGRWRERYRDPTCCIVITPQRLLPNGQSVPGEPRYRSLGAGAFFSALMPQPGYTRTLPRGRYRACFRFLQGSQTTWQEQCSAPFILPPPEE